MKAEIKRAFFRAAVVAMSVVLVFNAGLHMGYADTEVKTNGQEKAEALLPTEDTALETNIGEAESTEDATLKIDITDFTVELDSYLAFATGEQLTPKVVSVSGEIRLEDKDKVEGEQELSEKVTLSEGEYSVKYYRVESFENEIYDEVDEITAVGEYKLVVKANDTESFEGEASRLFSVIGKAQHLTVQKTEYALTVKSTGPRIEAQTDGDGSGFEFSSSDEEVLQVSSDGTVQLKKAGQAAVYVTTVGDMLYQPAKVKINFDISPAKVKWDAKSMKMRKNKKTLLWKKQAGATSYEIMYSTSKSFKQTTKSKSSNKAAKFETKTVMRKGSTSKYTLKSLKKGKTYYVKIRAVTKTVDSRGNEKTLIGAWSSVRKINIK